MLIDAHTHCFPDPVAPKAISALTSAYGLTPTCDGTTAGMLKLMDADGVDIAVVLPVATRPEQVEGINKWVLGVASERIVCFGAIHPAYPDPIKQCKLLKVAGVPGVKLQPNWQRFSPDSREAEPLYDAIEQAGLICYFHAGDEIDGSWDIVATPESIARVHERHPGMTMVAAHLGGYLMWDRARKHLIGRDIYLDTSFCRDQDISDQQYADLILEHGTNRVILGSDAPCEIASRQKQRVDRLPISEEEKEGICWRNCAQLLGL